MITVKDIIPVLSNQDKSVPEKVRIQYGGERKDFLVKKDLMLAAFDDYIVDRISFDWEEKIWVINVKIEPIRA